MTQNKDLKPAHPIEEGMLAPDFTLSDQNGQAVSLADFRGRTVVIYFYPKDNTPGCTKQAIGFTALYDQFKALDCEVLGISPDGEASHLKFIDKFSIPYPLLCDEDKSVMAAYGAYGEKMMYGKKLIGVIRSTAIVDAEGKVIKHWKRVPKAADHPEKVLAFLQSR